LRPYGAVRSCRAIAVRLHLFGRKLGKKFITKIRLSFISQLVTTITERALVSTYSFD
jgi:hypothetical protein